MKHALHNRIELNRSKQTARHPGEACDTCHYRCGQHCSVNGRRVHGKRSCGSYVSSPAQFRVTFKQLCLAKKEVESVA